MKPSAAATGEKGSHIAMPMTMTVVTVSCQLARPRMKGSFLVRMTLYRPILFLTVLCYVVLTQIVKTWLIRKAWI